MGAGVPWPAIAKSQAHQRYTIAPSTIGRVPRRPKGLATVVPGPSRREGRYTVTVPGTRIVKITDLITLDMTSPPVTGSIDEDRHRQKRVGVKKNDRRRTASDVFRRRAGSLSEVIHSSLADRGPYAGDGQIAARNSEAAVGGMKMSVTIKRITLWRIEVENKPGVLARTLEPLAGAGWDLEVVMGYPETGDKAAIEIYPVAGKKAVAAAQAAGLAASSIPTLLVEGDNRAGLGM